MRAEHRLRRIGLVLVLIAAVALRIATYAEIKDGPVLYLHTWTQSDMSFFDGWARAIVAGDVLSRGDIRPYHRRHRKLACTALARRDVSAACDDAAIKRVWDGWVGEHTFWQDPLYPYALAALYKSAGRSVHTTYAAQAAAGLACIVLAYQIAALLFGVSAALATAVLATLFGPLLFYETLLLRTVAIALAGLLSVRLLLAVLTREHGGWLWAEMAGLALGVNILLKSSNCIFAVIAMAIVMWSHRHHPAWALGLSAMLMAGMFVVFTPLIFRNLSVGIAPLSLAATGPVNFINGNAADRSPGDGSAVSSYSAGILETSGVDGAAVVAATIATYQDAGVAAWARLLWGKFVVFWQSREIPNNANYGYFLEHASVLSRIAIGFGVLAPLALWGMALALRRQPLAAPALGYIIAGIAVCVAFYNLSRFRLPIACMMLPFAGYAVNSVIEALAARRFRTVVVAAATITAMTIAMHTGAPPTSVHRLSDYGVHNQIAEHLARIAPSPAAALSIIERQLATEPVGLSNIVPRPAPTTVSAELAAIAGTFITLHEQAADVLGRLGRGGEAELQRRRASLLRAINEPYQRALQPPP